MSGKPLEFRQIITKAVCGKGRKFCQSVHAISAPDGISSILGAWAINHSFTAKKAGESVEVRGKFDLNIWYSTRGNTNTEVFKETIRYVEKVPLSYVDKNVKEKSVKVNAIVTQSPNCVEATLSTENKTIVARIEKELVVELEGETKITVAVYPSEYGELDEKGIVSNLVEEEEAEINQFEELDPELVIDDLDD